jgi:hypothetical protein
MNRLYVDLKEDCNGHLTGPVKLPADGTFTFEAILEVVAIFAESVGKPSSEVLHDMHTFARSRDCGREI